MKQYRLLLFLGNLPKPTKIMSFFYFFLNTGPYAAGNFKVLFLPQVSLQPIHCKPCENIGYHGKSKCLLECRNLAFSTKITYFMPYPRLVYGRQRLLVRTTKSCGVVNVIYYK